MGRDEDKLIRQLSLLSFLLSRPRAFTAREIQESVEGYAEMSDETFTRRFHGDRSDLAKVGIEVGALSATETPESDAAQLYFLEPSDFRLPAVEFTAAEQEALAIALAALDGCFAYARPLRLALTAILRGRQDHLHEELERLPIVFAPDEDARRAGRQLSRLEDAVSRGKTVSFSYPDAEGGYQQRKVDPYSLFLIQSHWYLVGHDHLRDALRTFRVGRIGGSVKFPTEKPRDFVVPEDYEPEKYRARPPWLIGPVVGTATISIGEDLAWWVKRLEPHLQWSEESDGRSTFLVPYADEFLLLSWLTSLGGRSQVLEPPSLRAKARALLQGVARAHEGPVETGADASHTAPDTKSARTPVSARRKAEPIPAEHLARTISLLSYLLDEKRAEIVTWQQLEQDLGLTRKEVEEDLGLINLINFGGGTYALTAEASDEGVEVIPEVMADVFSQPARLSPAMAKALLLALDLVGDTFAVEGLGSLSSVRDKVDGLIGEHPSRSDVIVDELVHPDAAVVTVLNQAIRDHTVVEIRYFTAGRQELGGRQIEPYLLCHSPDGWYLEAYCRKACAQRTFKLERICEAYSTAETFAPRDGLDLTQRFGSESFPLPAQASWATVVFTPRWGTYLDERGTRYHLRSNGSIEAQVPYMDELWIAHETVRYLGDAVLEHPDSARRKVREIAASLASVYEETAQRSTPSGGDA